MEQLREFNNYILEEYNKIPKECDLACPLLVSSNIDYLNGLKRKILYIGQETNGWMNNCNVEELEDVYFRFLKDRCATKKDFWLFIEACLDIPANELVNNVIWSNTLIASKRVGVGAPQFNSTLEQISMEYLKFLYNYFKPDYTIFVNGPKNPYYKITIDFLKSIKSNLINNYPSTKSPLLIDEENNIFWTYHPNYQNRKGLKRGIIEEISTKIK